MDEILIKYKRDDGGWGVAPYDPNFTVNGGNQQAVLSWSLSDLVVDGKKICTVAGIVVRRKTTGYPKNENDGTLIVNSTDLQGTYTDTGLTNGTTYYYRAFPYSDHNVYGRDAYHAKGSATPSEATILTVRFCAGSVAIGETITARKGATEVTAVVGSDGTAALALNATGAWEVLGEKIDVDTLGSAITLKANLFAYHYSENDSSPASATYPAGYDNSDFTDPFYVNLTSGAPHYGDWDPADDDLSWLFPKSCMVKYDGTVDYYLDEDDETKKADGTASDVASAAYAGNAMMEWAQNGRHIYWKFIPDQDGKGFTFVVGNVQVLDLKPWNHYDCNDDVNSHFYTPKYFGSSDGTRLRSISGGSNYVNNTRNAEVSLARANNLTSDVIWDTEVYSDWVLIANLCCLISKSMNTQDKFGYGHVHSSNTSAIGQGTMNGKGMFFGKSDQTSGVKVFGMENIWGTLWRAIRGLVAVNCTIKAKLTHGTADGSTAADYNFDGTNYLTAGSYPSQTHGQISHMNVTEKTIVPTAVSGSETTFYCDYAWLYASGTYYAIVGGIWYYAAEAGGWICYLADAASVTGTDHGAALSLKPLAGA